MKISNVWAVYFSPTGTTERVVTRLAANLASMLDADYRVADLTKPKARKKPLSFDAESLVVMGMPVYAGRVPYFLKDHLGRTKGHGAKGIAVAVYGNRAYDGALAELSHIMEAQGIKVIAGGAFIGQHSFSEVLAAGRPDERDMEKVKEFYTAVYEKLERGETDTPEGIYDKDCDVYYKATASDGSKTTLLGAKPVTDEKLCVWCRDCARACPMEAVSFMKPSEIEGQCILCGACVRVCKKQAKAFTDPDYLFHKKQLEERYTKRKEPEIFI